MISCPHCSAETIDENKKIRSSGLFPARCSACKNYSYVRRPAVEEIAGWLQFPLIAIAMLLLFAQAWLLFAIAVAVIVAPYVYAHHRRKLATLHRISRTRVLIGRTLFFAFWLFAVIAGTIMYLHDK
jgi:prepilin signal peptidase PulO-like enzyme (type II secretory pathway)